MCKYCGQGNKTEISGAWLKVIATNSTKKLNPIYYKPRSFILKCKADKKAGLMIDNREGYFYININYCPMCGKKLGEWNNGRNNN